MLADSDQSWFTQGDFYIRENSPAGWLLDHIVVVGAINVQFKRETGELYFSLTSASIEEGGYVALHNVGPFTDPEPGPDPIPEPTTLALVGLAAAGGVRTRRMRNQ